MYRRTYENAPICTQEKAQRLIPAMTLTVEEMMDELHISRPTAYELVKQEHFPAFHVGSRILINRKGLQEWLDAQSV